MACAEEKTKPKPRPQLTKQQVQDLSVEMHTWDTKRQVDEINKYTERQGWKMLSTASGLRYMELKAGTGPHPLPEQVVQVEYVVKLMDGRICYSSKDDGMRSFVVAHDYVEYGIHEGVQLMRKGGEMRFILPSYLAHGFTGDGKKIPRAASLVIELKLVDIHDQ